MTETNTERIIAVGLDGSEYSWESPRYGNLTCEG